MPSPKKILAIKLRAMGDTVVMTAALERLRHAYPNAALHALVGSQFSSVLEGHPAVDRLITLDRRKERASRAKSLARMAMKLRLERYDCVVNFHASSSSAMLAFATGAPVRSVHFHGHTLKNRYSTVEIPGKGMERPIVERDLDAVRGLGLSIPEGVFRPAVYLSDEEKGWAREWIAGHELGDPLLVLGLAAGRPDPSWPVENFARLAIGWCERHPSGSALGVIGRLERELATRFEHELDRLLGSEKKDLRARIRVESGFTVRQLGSVMSRASHFVGNDSGPKLLAEAVGLVPIELFGDGAPRGAEPGLDQILALCEKR